MFYLMVYVVLFMHTHFYLLSIHYNFMDLSKALLFLALCMKREPELEVVPGPLIQ